VDETGHLGVPKFYVINKATVEKKTTSFQWVSQQSAFCFVKFETKLANKAIERIKDGKFPI
jgi:hypothetical protein